MSSLFTSTITPFQFILYTVSNWPFQNANLVLEICLKPFWSFLPFLGYIPTFSHLGPRFCLVWALFPSPAPSPIFFSAPLMCHHLSCQWVFALFTVLFVNCYSSFVFQHTNDLLKDTFHNLPFLDQNSIIIHSICPIYLSFVALSTGIVFHIFD